MKLQTPLIVILTSLAATSALAQKNVRLYHPGEDSKDQGISLRGWGSGTISQTDETFYEGSYSIRISTRSFFQGGVIDYAKPIDLSSEYGNKNDLLCFAYKLADSSVMGGGRPGGGFPGGGRPGVGGPGGGRPGGGFPGGGFPGGGIPGAGPGRGGFPGGGQGPGAGPGRGFPGGAPGQGFPGGAPGGPGQGFPGGPGRGFGQGGANQNLPTLKNLRFIITTTDGKKSECYLPINTSVSSDEQGWREVAVPLQSITGLDRTNKTFKSIAISGDATATFYVGDILIVNDSTPITGDVNTHDLNLANGDEFEFQATGTGGVTPLKYSWNFDAANGDQVDAEGQTVKRKFRRPGDYTVTCTIADLYGLKTPYTTKIHVVVNP